jgi:hypothetical protein
MSKSKFDAVLGGRRATTHESKVEPITPDMGEKRGRGRPHGKRSNPDYQQVTIYIPRALYNQTRITLIQEGGKEFSELVEELLTERSVTKKG